MLDESLRQVNVDIDAKLLPFEGKMYEKMKDLDEYFNEGQAQQTVIREILDSTLEKTNKNPNYVAYEIMENDPLNEQSVEYLSSQQQVWQDSCQSRQVMQE